MHPESNRQRPGFTHRAIGTLRTLARRMLPLRVKVGLHRALHPNGEEPLRGWPPVTPPTRREFPDLVWDPIHFALVMPKTGTNTLRRLLFKHLPITGTIGSAHMLDLVENVRKGRILDARPGPLADFLQMAEMETILKVRWDQRRRAIRSKWPVPPKPSFLSAVREPVSWVLSYIFYATLQTEGHEGIARLTPERIMAMLLGEEPLPFPHGAPVWWEVSYWYEENLEQICGVDVYATPFDTSRGWTILESDRVRLLLVRLENFDALPEAAGTFYGVPSDNITVPRVYGADELGYDEPYKALKRALVLPESLLDDVYSSRHVRHFYTEDEIRGFRAKWGAAGRERHSTGA